MALISLKHDRIIIIPMFKRMFSCVTERFAISNLTSSQVRMADNGQDYSILIVIKMCSNVLKIEESNLPAKACVCAFCIGSFSRVSKIALD